MGVDIKSGSLDTKTPENPEGLYPLRPIQRWMVDTNLQKAKSSMMNISGLVRLGENADMERLAQAIEKVLQTHDVFRCRLVFNPETGDICQRFDGEIAKVQVETCSDAAFEVRKRKFRRPYQFINNPLYRVYLMVAPSGKYMYVDFHHAIMDGTALLLFLRDLATYYKGLAPKRPAPGFAEYVRNEAKRPQGEMDKEADYWRRMLAGFDAKKHLPPADLTGHDDRVLNVLTVHLHNAAKTKFRKHPCKENTILMGAVMLAIAKAAGVKESVMSWVHNGRFDAEERRLMGLMLIQFPISWDFTRDCRVLDFLLGLEKKIEEGISHRQSIGAVYAEGLEDECASFILQKEGMIESDTLPFADTSLTFVEIPVDKASAAENVLDINVLTKMDGTYDLILKYDASRYSVAAMEKYARLVDEVLLAVLDDKRLISEILP